MQFARLAESYLDSTSRVGEHMQDVFNDILCFLGFVYLFCRNHVQKGAKFQWPPRGFSVAKLPTNRVRFDIAEMEEEAG